MHCLQEAYISGEQHVLNDVFRQIGTEDAAVRTAFQHARDKMSSILEAAIEKQEEQEKTAAVDAELKKHWIKPGRVDDEMRGIYKVLPFLCLFILQALFTVQNISLQPRTKQGLGRACGTRAFPVRCCYQGGKQSDSQIHVRMSTTRTSSCTIFVIWTKR